MTITITPPTAAEGIGATTLFRPVVVLTVLIAVISMLWQPPAWVVAVVVIGVVASVGIPHGALDDRVVVAAGWVDPDRSSQRGFLVRYVLAMVGVALVWLASPEVALVAFLLASIHHFGQSDLAHVRLGGRAQSVLQWSRGLFLVGVPLVAHLAEIAPIVAELGVADLRDRTGWAASTAWSGTVTATLIGQHVVVGAVLARRVRDPHVVVREAVTVAVLTVLFLAAHPLVGFAVYFGLWHSLGHLVLLADVLDARPRRVRTVVRMAAPLTAVAIAGLGAAWLVALRLDRLELLVPLLFVGISMLTAPHLVVVERLWRAR